MSRLKGRIFFEPEDSVTTVLAGREEFRKPIPSLHRQVCSRLTGNSPNGFEIIPKEAQQRVR